MTYYRTGNIYVTVLKQLFVLLCFLCFIIIVLMKVEEINDPEEKKHKWYPKGKYWAVNERTEEFTPSPGWMQNMSFTMEKRKEELQKNCNSLGLDVPGNDSLHKPNGWEFLINHEHHLVWCNVFKAASTSWMYNFNILAGYKPEFLRATKQIPLLLARRKYARPSVEELKKALVNSTSFMIVRHPLERLLSGFRDKIEFAIPNSYHHKLGSTIILKYRKQDPANRNILRTSRDRKPTFAEFIQYLIDLHKNRSKFDMHWTPFTEFCTPCQIRFDVIMKFETLNDDQNYLIRKTNLQNWIKPQWMNSSKDNSKTKNLIKKYYSQLTKSQIQQLYTIYLYDFKLFGYTLDPYLRYGS